MRLKLKKANSGSVLSGRVQECIYWQAHGRWDAADAGTPLSGQGLCGPGLQWAPQGTRVGGERAGPVMGGGKRSLLWTERAKAEAPVTMEGEALNIQHWYSQEPWKDLQSWSRRIWEKVSQKVANACKGG